MREPPVNLIDSEMQRCLQDEYGLAVDKITFLDLGADSRAWVYRVICSGAQYFLKVRQSITNKASLHVTHYLHEHDVSNVMAPLPTVRQTMWAELNGYLLILYPFIEGSTGRVQGMSESQWITYGTTVRRIHGTDLPADLAAQMNRELFVPVGPSMVRDIELHLRAASIEDPTAEELAELWDRNREVIRALSQRAEELGSRLAQSPVDFGLCHADIHTDNVMIDSGGKLWIVDWDETVLAPKERDLMFVVGGGISRQWVSPTNEQLFLQGYGDATIDPLAIAYYRYAWAISDIGDFGTQVLLRADLGPQSRRTALEFFKTLFLPGNIVENALGSQL